MRRWPALLLMLASGFAGLGYQIVWTQQFALLLGHESAAVLAVIAAFFGGLALGAQWLGRTIERSADPRRWYAGCELAIGAWAAVLVFAIRPISNLILDATGAEPGALRQWSLAFGGCFALLLPATMAMGATLPAMAQVLAGGARASIASLYAANTFGAVLGVLTSAFWLVPVFGLSATASIFVGLNLACGVAALRVLPDAVAATPATDRHAAGSTRGPLLRLAATGLLGIGYEVVVVRVLSEVDEDTVYTYALLLAIYLIGAAAGAALHARWRRREAETEPRRDALIAALALACIAGAARLWSAEALRGLAMASFGGGMAAALAAEALVAFVAFGLPTVAMGALFSELANEADACGIGYSRALAVNTLGAALAPPLFGVLLLPALGPKLALCAIVLGYLLLIRPVAWRRGWLVLPALGLAALAAFAPRLAFIEVPEGGHLVRYEDGRMAAVSVVEDAEGVRRLRINNRQQEGTSATRRVDGRQAMLPLLLHPAPRRALFLGLGTGTTATVAAADPGLSVEAVELLPEVIAAAPLFRGADDAEAAARLRLRTADARRAVRAGETRYDLIVADNFHPARSGSGALYTVEHFAAVRARLSPGGLFCQWLPLHQLDLDTLRSIVRSFLAVYPEGFALLANYGLDTPVLGLVGRPEGGGFDPAVLHKRLAEAQPEAVAARFAIDDEYALLGGFVAGPSALGRFAGAAPLNTDDHPVVAYRAPHITYAPDSQPRERLAALLRELDIEPDELLSADAEPPEARRLAAYWQARDRFIAAGLAVRPSADPAAMLAQVREPLLAVLRISPDFRPAYEPLLAMAKRIAMDDPATAARLLRELDQVAPNRRDAAETLAALSGTR